MSNDTRKAFPFLEFEPRWQARWEAEKTYRTPNPGDPDFDPSKPKFYALDMFPYPSGDGLHVGHPEGYTATDIISRARRKQGYNVLHPMGWDAFGLPAEQYAIKTGQHPRVTTERNVARFTGQLKRLGFAYDWDREVNTTDPRYFKWTQWIFLQIYHSWFNPATRRAEAIATYTGPDPDSVRLAYVAEVPVNWCPGLGTVLANEEVVDGKSEVGGFAVERRPMKQWMLRITAFADRLAEELEPLEWSAGIKTRQRDWIGRSEGAEVRFQIPGHESPDGTPAELVVFTTRPDTLFGATYMVLAPEHPLVPAITTPAHQAEVEAYRQTTASKSDLDRGVAKDKTGVDTGATAVNPVNGEAIPVWIADYVMMGYGTGAIMAVPAHDERDFEFATRFHLPIRQVVERAAEGGAGVSPASEKSDPLPFSSNPFFESGVGVHVTSRRLPHWDQGDKCYFVTWRLKDSVPEGALKKWHDEKREWLTEHPQPWDPETEAEYHSLFSDRMEAWLDAGTGSRVLARPDLADLVVASLHHFDGQRYDLDAFVVMPTHVHVAVHLRPGETLSKVLHSWKSFSAKEINRSTDGSGPVWQDESFDRIIHNEKHWHAVLEYITDNPVRAKLREGEFSLYRAGVHPKGTAQKSLAGETPAPPSLACFAGEGVAVNSGFLDGLPTEEAKRTITAWLEEKRLGRRTVHYKLRDWLFARQRYWGEPFPIVWENGRHRAVPESELPVLPPTLEDFKPTGTPEPPLSKALDWVRYSDTATRELNTMPQWAGSCWYYLRYCDARNSDRFVSAEAERYWMGGGAPAEAPTTDPPSPTAKGGVDLYVGGTEHAVLHLLYARFWHKVLFDLGHVSTPEPFHKLVNQGLILGEDGQKMSKSRGNVVNPDSVVEEFGADSLRLFEMFMGPLEATKPWSTKGVEGVHRFLARVWRLVMAENQEGAWAVSPKLSADASLPSKARKVLHETIKKVTEDIEALSFNTAIAQMMICTNELTSQETRPVDAVVTLLHLLNPFAPHLTEELYASLAAVFPALPPGQMALHPWPTWDPAALVESEIELVVQVNGKLRDRVTVAADADQAAHETAALASPKVREHTDGKTVRKVIVVPRKLVNIVAN